MEPWQDKNETLKKLLGSDGSSLRLGPGSDPAQHLEGLLEVWICRLDLSIGMGQASGSCLSPQAQARLELGIWRLDPSLVDCSKKGC